ncbi:MAG TPA: dihydrolipoamide acetyltransferase family protein [Casimicrobiaceae bacterium]
MVQFVMPKLGADMTSGKLVEWSRHEGDPVRRGEIIALIETDKTNVETESFVDGVLEKILVEPHDEWLPVGTPLALIRVPGETDAQFSAPPPGLEIAAAPTAAAVPAAAPPRATIAPAAVASSGAAAPEAAGERLRISPAARKHAADLGIDATNIRGTGPGGRITLEDVERERAPAPAAAAPVATPTAAPVATPPAAPAPAADRATRMRDAIAATMARSKREIPHYYLETTIGLARALGWLEARNRDRPVTERILPGALLIKATAVALRAVPELNGFWRDGRAERSTAIHVGVAISLRGGGLVAPAVHDTDRLSLDALMKELQALTQRARAGTLRSSEMTDPTITVSSLGDRGAESLFGVIYPPQLALVGFGRIVERPWSVGGQVVSAPVVHATLSADHRATDGHRGALLLDALDSQLQRPEEL